jgi:hypothetical protein
VSTAPRQPLVRAIADLLAAFKAVGAAHMIIGGLAVIARGVVRRLHRSRIDLAYIRDRITEFATAIDEPERVDQFDAIVTRMDRELDA